jgi:hypothetical protein
MEPLTVRRLPPTVLYSNLTAFVRTGNGSVIVVAPEDSVG